MNHYECRDCGSYLGVSFGSCNSCTPLELRNLIEKVNTAKKDAERSFLKLNEELLQRHIKAETQHLEEEFNAMWNKYAPKGKRL